VFNYLKVTFPNTTLSPSSVLSFNYYQNRYKHEVAVIKFRDWNVEYSVISSGSPVQFQMFHGVTAGAVKTFYGYVHHVSPTRTPGQNITEVTVIGASWVMKNESQHIYKGLSADAIVTQMAKKYKFASFTVSHPRVFPQVSQAGHTDWGLLVRLAKQCGYSLRTENTEIYFQPMLYEYTNYRSQAPRFIMRESNNPGGSTIYSFKPMIGESIPYEQETKAATAVSGIDRPSINGLSLTQPTRNKKTRSSSSLEFFDKYETSIVANNADTAKHEAKAAEDRASFPYRATVEVKGDPLLRPDMPVYLQGVGAQYEGYWTILGTEHKIYEKERNNQIYTTILTVGSDSLGAAVTWTDNQTITQPATTPTRTIIPGVTQTVITPKSTLINTTPYNLPQKKGTFGTLNNRTGDSISSPTWISQTVTLNPILTVPGSSSPTRSTAQASIGTIK